MRLARGVQGCPIAGRRCTVGAGHLKQRCVLTAACLPACLPKCLPACPPAQDADLAVRRAEKALAAAQHHVESAEKTAAAADRRLEM